MDTKKGRRRRMGGQLPQTAPPPGSATASTMALKRVYTVFWETVGKIW